MEGTRSPSHATCSHAVTHRSVLGTMALCLCVCVSLMAVMQVLLFTATMPDSIQAAAARWLRPGAKHVRSNLSAASISNTIVQVNLHIHTHRHTHTWQMRRLHTHKFSQAANAQGGQDMQCMYTMVHT